MKSGPKIYLASCSPRRRALLSQIGVAFAVIPVDLDESRLPGEPPADYVRRVALDKARAGRSTLAAGDPPLPVLAADTAVVVDDEVLGKPQDRADAAAMMARLSGRTHQVLTAVALVQPCGSPRATRDSDNTLYNQSDSARADEVERLALNVSEVRFRAVSDAECAAYWLTGEPADKAGGYAIQGLGALFVEELHGSFSGVVGLPLLETSRLLEAAGVAVLPGA